MAERCPVCGDEIRNGRCVFCGHRPTEADAEAAKKYAAQKAAFAGGDGSAGRPRRSGPGPGKKDPPPERRGRDAPGRAESKAPNDRATEKAGKAEKPAERRDQPKGRDQKGRSPERQDRRPAEGRRQPAGKSRDKPEHKRPPLARRLLFKFVVFAWIALYLWLILGKITDDAERRLQDPPGPATSYGQGEDCDNTSDGLPDIADGGLEGGSR